MHRLLRSDAQSHLNTPALASHVSPSSPLSLSLSLPVSLNILSAWRQAAVTGQRLVTRWRAMRAVSSGLAGPDGLVGRCARKCKIQLDTTRSSLLQPHFIVKEAGAEVACSFHCTYVCMCVCARACFCFVFFVTREMIYLGETIFIRYLILAKVRRLQPYLWHKMLVTVQGGHKTEAQIYSYVLLWRRIYLFEPPTTVEW